MPHSEKYLAELNKWCCSRNIWCYSKIFCISIYYNSAWILGLGDQNKRNRLFFRQCLLGFFCFIPLLSLGPKLNFSISKLMNTVNKMPHHVGSGKINQPRNVWNRSKIKWIAGKLRWNQFVSERIWARARTKAATSTVDSCFWRPFWDSSVRCSCNNEQPAKG